ncbi:sulfite exporter TauE/SafE family protein [Sphingomonas sp. SUN039]|uniref:sulfite exporter TauE/SafE family protein n=1 Tax=Sphingomonas sp. SUN039 TaxID=2937787 RepID=UPI0021643998|nr:sulfite exporter TauE/SafE family protein [Sphingomonas sp. SUN039]UVO53545.1 sulfite exporter TauE/SafE family protein [Sphingomonas sp. SUN039]
MTALAAAFFLTALLYASVGFGGGSTYIALLVLAGVSAQLVPVIAPLCNIVVVTGGTIRFARAGLVPWRRVLPLVIVSAPLAYLGGLTPIKQATYIAILGASLFVAGLLLLFQRTRAAEATRKTTGVGDAAIGGAVGYLSGLVGIGGGIFLSPLQHLMRWGPPRQIAATASVFILVNSIAGLAGQLNKLGTSGLASIAAFWPLLVAVLIGGQIGTHAGIRIFSEPMVRRATGVLILYVSGQLLWKTFSG